MSRRTQLRLALEICLVVIIAGSTWNYRVTNRAPSPQTPQHVVYELPNSASEGDQIVAVVMLEGIRDSEPVADISYVLTTERKHRDIKGREVLDWSALQSVAARHADKVILIHISVENPDFNSMSDIVSTIKSIKLALPRGQKCLIKFYL